MTTRTKEPVDGMPVLVRLSVADRLAVEAVATFQKRDMGELIRLYVMPQIRKEASELPREGTSDDDPPPKPKSGTHSSFGNAPAVKGQGRR